MRSLLLSSFVLILGSLSTFASEDGARRVVAEYESAYAKVGEDLQRAVTLEERRLIWQKAPKPAEFGRKLLKEIDGSWNKEWMLEYGARLIDLAPDYAMKPLPGGGKRTPLTAIRDSAARFLFKSPKIGPLAVALTVDKSPETRNFLEKLEATHPDSQVRGQAALALAIALGRMGEGGSLTAKRLQYLEKAIKDAGEPTAQIGRRTLQEWTERLLAEITKLEQGRDAPDLLGWNIAGEAMRLSDFRGQPVVLVFWHTRMEAAEETLEYLRKIDARLSPRGVQVLGVAAEEESTLRNLVKDGTVTWKNWRDDKGELAQIYQVWDYPAAWVLDKEGVVQYRGVPGSFLDLTAEALVE